MEKIFFISGKSGSGKTELKKRLMDYCEKEKLPTKGFKFASHIYSIHDKIMDYLSSLKLPYEIKDKDRSLLISLGEWGRCSQGNLWAKLLSYSVSSVKEKSVKIGIIDDLRFPTELTESYDLIKTFIPETEFIVVRLQASTRKRKQRAGEVPYSGHTTEESLDFLPYIGNKFLLYSYLFFNPHLYPHYRDIKPYLGKVKVVTINTNKLTEEEIVYKLVDEIDLKTVNTGEFSYVK